MQRRGFVRLVGGGVVMAAAAPLAGCSSEIPPEALEAWQAPAAQPDVRRWILAHAILAPNSHNLQSWLVDLSEPGALTLYCDRTRLLPETDPFSRQIMMAQGTFLELLDLAARERGLRAQITLFPQGEFAPERIDERPVAQIRLQADAGVSRDPLFAQIFRRHTNRNAYDPARPPAPEAWAAMAAAAQPYPIRFGPPGAEPSERLARQRAIATEAWRIELTTARTILESYKVLRVGAAEIARHRDGLALTSPLVVALARLGLFDRTKAPAPDSWAITGQIREFAAKLDATPAFLSMVSADNRRVTQVDAGRAYARVQLAATAHGVVMHPLQQALQEYAEVAPLRHEIHRLLDATAPGQTVQMWARVGYAADVAPAPRRGVDAIIRG